MNKSNIDFIAQKAKEVRRDLLEKFILTEQGHPGSVFSMVDLACALYYGNQLKLCDNDNIFQDKVIVSKGHATATLYPILVDFGIIERKEWDNWGKSDSNLRVFGNTSIPGIDVTSGSLGHGLGIASGFARSFKDKKKKNNVYVFLSEGELYEGSSWESLMYISSNNLNNVKIVLDRNSLIILGNTENAMKLEPIDDKIRAFGFDVYMCNGHDINEILNNLDQMKNSVNPSCLIADTVKGRGVSFMENKPEWHYWNPLTNEQIDIARSELA